MKRIISLVLAVLLVATVFAVPALTEMALADSYAGYWHVTTQKEGDDQRDYYGSPALRLPEGSQASMCYPSELNASDAHSMELLLNEDGTCVFDCLGVEAQEGTWTEDGGKIKLTVGGCSISLTIKEDKLRYREEIGADLYHDLFFERGDYAASDLAKNASSAAEEQGAGQEIPAIGGAVTWKAKYAAWDMDELDSGDYEPLDPQMTLIPAEDHLTLSFMSSADIPEDLEGVPAFVRGEGVSFSMNPDGTATLRVMGAPEVQGVWVEADGILIFEGSGWAYDMQEGAVHEAVWRTVFFQMNENQLMMPADMDGEYFFFVFERSNLLAADVMAADATVRADATVGEFCGTWVDRYELLSGGVRSELQSSGYYLMIDESAISLFGLGMAETKLVDGAISLPLSNMNCTVRLHEDGLISVQMDKEEGTLVRFFEKQQ